jgi:ABC-type sulfate transport system permease component
VQKLNYDAAHTFALILLLLAFVMLLAMMLVQRKISSEG